MDGFCWAWNHGTSILEATFIFIFLAVFFVVFVSFSKCKNLVTYNK